MAAVYVAQPKLQSDEFLIVDMQRQARRQQDSQRRGYGGDVGFVLVWTLDGYSEDAFAALAHNDVLEQDATLRRVFLQLAAGNRPVAEFLVRRRRDLRVSGRNGGKDKNRRH